MFGRFRTGRPGSPAIDAALSITQARYVSIDTELTGLDEKKDAIVSLGAVRMTGGTIRLGETFYRLVKPAKALTAESVVIHEITPSDVEEVPGIDAALAEFLGFCGNDILLGHFLSIDLGFLNREAKRQFGSPVKNAVVDTFSVHEWLRLRLRDHPCFASPARSCQLYDIAKCFGIPVNGAHNALMDAYTTAQLFQWMIPMLQTAGVRDIGSLVKIGIPFEGGESTKRAGEYCNL